MFIFLPPCTSTILINVCLLPQTGPGYYLAHDMWKPTSHSHPR